MGPGENRGQREHLAAMAGILDRLRLEVQGRDPRLDEALELAKRISAQDLEDAPQRLEGRELAMARPLHQTVLPFLDGLIADLGNGAALSRLRMGFAAIAVALLLVLNVALLWLRRDPALAHSDAAAETGALAVLTDHLGDGVITIDAAGTIELFNPAAEKIFGYSAAEVIGENVNILLPNEEREQHDASVRGSKLHESRIINRVRDLWGQRKDGSLFPMELNVARLGDSGAPNRFVGVFRDISERKDWEQRLISERNAADLARRSAQAANQAKSQFLAAMSHELRTPLNAILGFSQLLESRKFGDLNKTQIEYLDYVTSSGKHLLGLIDELLELSRVEAGRADLSLESLSADPVIKSAMEVARLLAVHRDITIVDRRDGQESPNIVADPIRLKQILLNLLTNAVKYNRQGGTVFLDQELIEGHALRLLITDTGRGIDPKEVSNLFTSFHRLGAEASGIEGTGIGLFLTRRLVEAMKGQIGFETTPGTGSTFWFELPLDLECGDSESAGRKGQLEYLAPANILLVDDDPVTTRLVEVLVRQLPGLEILSAHNSEIAWALVRDRHPALILVDLDLPGFDALAFCQRITSEIQDAKIIAISDGFAAVEKLRRAAGHDFDHLQKPLRIESLRDVLAAVG